MQYILYALVHLEASYWILGTGRDVIRSITWAQPSVTLTTATKTSRAPSLTMPFDARNAVFNGDYNDNGSNYYFVQVNDGTEGIDQYPHVR